MPTRPTTYIILPNPSLLLACATWLPGRRIAWPLLAYAPFDPLSTVLCLLLFLLLIQLDALKSHPDLAQLVLKILPDLAQLIRFQRIRNRPNHLLLTPQLLSDRLCARSFSWFPWRLQTGHPHRWLDVRSLDGGGLDSSSRQALKDAKSLFGYRTANWSHCCNSRRTRLFLLRGSLAKLT